MSIYGRRGCNDLFSGGFAKKGMMLVKMMKMELKLFLQKKEGYNDLFFLKIIFKNILAHSLTHFFATNLLLYHSTLTFYQKSEKLHENVHK
jgi:hypothetical protein